MNKRYTGSVVVIAVAFLALAGCAAPSAQPSFHLRQDIDLSTIKKVAVLPLENLTNDKYAADAVRHVIVNELLVSGVVDVSMPGDAMAAAEKAGVRTVTTMSEDQIKKVGAALKVQAVIFGAVGKYGEIRSGQFSAPEVTITLMMADTQTGSIVWSVTRSSVGDNFMARHFGARAETLSETTIKVVREALQTMKTY